MNWKPIAGGDISTRGWCPKYNPLIFKILFYFSHTHEKFRKELKSGEFWIGWIKWNYDGTPIIYNIVYVVFWNTA